MSDRQNVVLVSIDSLRADHCGYLGSEHDLTPTLDSLAADGIAFENAVAPGPQTFSSMPAVFTGRQRPPGDVPAQDGDTHWERRMAAIEDHLDTYAPIPQRLQQLGYSTAGITPNPWTSRVSGFDRGFDTFVDRSSTESEGWFSRFLEWLPGLDTDRKSVELLADLLTGRSFFSHWESLADDVDSVRDELSEPYFLWVFVLDAHFPYIASRAHREEQSSLGMYYSNYGAQEAMRHNTTQLPASARESLLASYRDTVRAVDAFLAELCSTLEADDPAFVVHSDHGESFGEHGNYGHHHRQVYEENIHVPFVVSNVGDSGTVQTPTSLRTIHDTVLALAGDGQFEPLAGADRPAVATSECGTHRAVRDRQFKYVDSDGSRQLFDLREDAAERRDVSDRFPERCRALRETLESQERHVAETVRIDRVTQSIAAESDL